ncbi:hypothetical protein AB9P05_09675 [Roseivirga sp. BDSF3-8]|uniref:hypothetical protein n=1 Tax=Roseivirga sp. BDSF3-8 TaxID=3241598 RepID=UPI003532734F
MRTAITIMAIFILIAAISPSMAQNQSTSEYSTYFELSDRLNFKPISDRYQLEDDTILYSFPGFIVSSNFDTATIQNQKYAILEYPSFKGNKQIPDPSPRAILPNSPVRVSIVKGERKFIATSYSDFMAVKKDTLYDISWWELRNYRVTTGLLTVPFKLRPEVKEENFTMSTDVTIGPYLGVTKRISKRHPYYLTFPATFGLSFININNNTTTTTEPGNGINTVPGFSWSTGLIFQLNKFDVGFVTGQDYASDVGNDWIYQGRLWYSFAIGYSFSRSQ